MAGLDPAIHVLLVGSQRKTWMPGNADKFTQSAQARLRAGHDGVCGAPQLTVMLSSPTILEPSSSVQVRTTGPDSCALNLNWIYGLADTAGSKSAANTSLPFTVQVNLLRIWRGITLPSLSLRLPVSMMCDTKAFTSMRSPFLASFLSSLMRGLTAIEISPENGLSLRCAGFSRRSRQS